MSALALLAMATACTLPPEPRSPKGLAAAEAGWIAALEGRDVAVLACRLDPTFVDNSWRGAVRTRAEVLAALPGRTGGHIELLEVESRIEGDVGVVRGLSLVRDAAGRPANRARFTDIFLYRGHRWVAVAAQETPVLD